MVKKKTSEEKQKEKDIKRQPDYMKSNDFEYLAGELQKTEDDIERIKKESNCDDNDARLVHLVSKRESIKENIKSKFPSFNKDQKPSKDNDVNDNSTDNDIQK